MNLKSISLDMFLCSNNREITSGSKDSFLHSYQPFIEFIGDEVRNLGGGYTIHQLKTSIDDFALIHDGIFVGFYQGELIAIHPDHQNKKLSVPLILEAVKNRPLPNKRNLTEGGLNALTYAWNVANGHAPDPWP